MSKSMVKKKHIKELLKDSDSGFNINLYNIVFDNITVDQIFQALASGGCNPGIMKRYSDMVSYLKTISDYDMTDITLNVLIEMILSMQGCFDERAYRSLKLVLYDFFIEGSRIYGNKYN